MQLYFYHKIKQKHLINYGITTAFLVFFSTGLRVLERYSQTEKLQKELEKEKLNSELALLKNQISPHFFFNTLNNYIDLMKLRMSEKIRLSLTFPSKYEDISIPPLLFIPFIENAFKHGISYREKSFIDISMSALNNTITFRCANSLIKSREEAEAGHSGIGLENVSKRLNLLFPDKYELQINKTNTTFEALLYINFA